MSTGSTFGDAGVWSYLLLLALIFISLLVANIIKQKVAPMRRTLIPVSVLGGLLLLIISTVCKVISGDYLFNLELDFPHPPFYNNLFRMWGLEEGDEWEFKLGGK